MCYIKVERAEEALCYVTSLQGAIAFHNISPRTVAEKQTELESSGRPGKPKPEQVCERYKRKAATEVWRFWNLRRAGLQERTRNSVLYVR